MNCQEFEQIVAELSADWLASARTRIAALAHAASCESCDARLAAEKKLNAGLSALAETTSREQAPLWSRQALRAEFEARQERIAEEAAASGPVRLAEQQSFWSKIRRLWAWEFLGIDGRWQLAAAAAAVIVFAIAVSVWRNQEAPEQSKLLAGSSPTPVASLSPKVTETPEQPPEQSNDVAPKLATTHAPRETVKNKREIKPRRQQPVQANKTDLAANYIPLSYAAGSATPGESLVVRVAVPRTTLIAMGLPLSAELGNELVKADLRVGLDGVPLAIRLVRP